MGMSLKNPGRKKPPHLSGSLWLHQVLRLLLAIRVWFSEKMQPSESQRTLVWAGVVGVLGGLAVLSFRIATQYLRMLLTGERGGIVESSIHLSHWQRLVIPTVGSLVAGGILFFGSRLKTGHNTTDYMEAVTLGDGVLSARRSLVKMGSSMFSVAAGASIGREGAMVQLSALCSALLGRINRWSIMRRRLMVACGASAGLAAAYNAPIGGALFVAEILLGAISMESFGPLIIASVFATQTTHYLSDNTPIYGIPPFELRFGLELLPHAVLGALCGILAPLYLRVLRLSEKCFGALRLPAFARLGLGGLVVGMLAIYHPQVCGNGYSVVVSILSESWMWQTLAILLLTKLAATCATFGSGAVGGVFTPTLFMGASVGYLFGVICAVWWPSLGQAPSAFALVGMGMFLAGATHAPLMAIIMIFEMTLDYPIILPLMLGCVLSATISHGIEPKSLYLPSMERRGALEFQRHIDSLKVGHLMKPDPIRVRQNERFSSIAKLFLSHTFKYLYVVDEHDVYQGAISLHEIKEVLNITDVADLVVAQELVDTTLATLTPGFSLGEAADFFKRHDGERLPVLSEDMPQRLVGSIAKTDVLLALADRLKN